MNCLNVKLFPLIYPAVIEVEDGNETFSAVNNCLIRSSDKTLVMGCNNSIIPEDGSVEIIGACAFNFAQDLTKMNPNPLVLPNTIKEIRYRAFAVYAENDIHIIVPESVEKIGLMAFMMKSGTKKCTVTFLGSPELETGVFGTKAEANDTDYEIYKTMPDCIYTLPNELLVRAHANSGVIDYCKKYGIPYTLI